MKPLHKKETCLTEHPPKYGEPDINSLLELTVE